ncbi:MAG TPA: hypothetical protein VN132_04545 [Bdellovibrio sp.]|nr:hypothetical protein [Bdellovibrio sp.]
MINKSTFVSLLFLLASSATWAAEAPTSQKMQGGVTVTQTAPNTVEASKTVEVQAKVLSVNKKTREITLKTMGGEEVSMVAGDEVKNFDQIKKNDMLKVNYLESLVLTLKKGGGQPVTVTENTDVSRAEPGQKPNLNVTNKVTARGTVIKIDNGKQDVTVRGPKRTVVLHIAKEDIFKGIKVGDQIETTYTEALAVSVETVKK